MMSPVVPNAARNWAREIWGDLVVTAELRRYPEDTSLLFVAFLSFDAVKCLAMGVPPCRSNSQIAIAEKIQGRCGLAVNGAEK
jgi:hypothetical protein